MQIPFEHTFVIPAYGESTFLEECIFSLENQFLKSEIILCTSTPNFYIENICEKHHIKLHINSNKNGIASDWNFALNKAETKYVTIAHQDDYYDENFSLILSQKANLNSVLFFFTDYSELIKGAIKKNSINLIIKKLLLFPYILKSKHNSNFFKKLPLIFGNPICCPSVTLNKELLLNFKFSEEYSYNLDWKAWLDISEKKGCFVYVNKRLMKHRIHEDSQTSIQIKSNLRHREELKIFENIWGKRIGKSISKFYKLSSKSNHY